MSTPLRPEYFGPYKLIRPIGSTRGAARFVVLCGKTDTNYMLYRFDSIANHQHRRRIFDALVSMSTLVHPHLLKIESASYDDQGRLCVITPYTGNHEGLVTLADLLENRDGKLGVLESARAIEHLLDACDSAHKQGICNGPIDTDNILVDRFGCIQIELYGYAPGAQGIETPRTMLIADEIRSIVEIAYTMITGLPGTGDRLAASRVVKRLDRNWDTWFEIGLDPIDGFENAEHALKAMPTNPDSDLWLTAHPTRRPQVHIGAMLRRFKPAHAARARSRRG